MSKSVIFTTYNYFSSPIMMREISKYRVLTRDEERALAEAVKRGDKAALDKLVNSNLRIAVTKSKQMALAGVKWEELMGAAEYGLVKAAQTFDPGRNVPFVAHAEFWVAKEILLELNTRTSMIHVPESQMRVLSKVRKAYAKYEQTYESQPTVYDIAEMTGLPVSKIKDAMSSCPSMSSYDAPLSDDADSAAFIETMYDEKQPMPDSVVSNESEKAYLVDILSSYLKTRDDAELFYYSAVLKNPDKLQEYMDKFQISEKELVRRTNAAIAILRKSKELVQLLKRIS